MSPLVYLLRSRAQTLPSALYPHNDSSVMSLVLESADGSVDLSQPAVMIQSGGASAWKVGEKLTYKQLLDLVLEVKKVITL